MKKVNIKPLDVKQEQLNAYADNVLFKPNKLGFHGVDTKIMSDAVVKSLRRIAAVSNSNLIRNADSLLCQKDIGDDVEWVGGVTRATPEKFKVSYYMCLPNEIWLHILMYLDYVFNFSQTLKRFNQLVYLRSDFKQSMCAVWSVFGASRSSYFDCLERCLKEWILRSIQV